MNYKMIRYTLGWLLIFEAAFFLLPILTGIIYRETAAFAFLWSLLLSSCIGLACIIKKPVNTKLYSRDGFVIVALSWIFLSIFGALPFVFSGAVTSFIDALFEAASGFTTTGASIFASVEDLPKSILIWRSFTNWIGGMGILVFIMAFLPLGGAHNMNIMKAESPGPSVSKLVPRVKTTALILYVIYFSMTALQFIILVCGRTAVFDAICISFSTAGTGGFGIRNDGFASYSEFVQIVTTVFMLMFSINFGSYYLLLRGRLKESVNTEVKTFVVIVAAAIAVLTADNLFSGIFNSFGESLKHSAFTVSSIISTTGFASADFALWNNLSQTIIVILMFIGACAGSTGGGIKVSRILILVKGMAKELKMLVHPKQVKKISIDSRPVEHEVVRSVNAYMVCYLAVFAVSVIMLSLEETDLVTNFTAVASAVNNIGPGLEKVGPMSNFGHLSILSKLTLTFDMLAGRLELFPMLVLFNPSTWKK
jgi:trk system potassium uptake protein TrkH